MSRTGARTVSFGSEAAHVRLENVEHFAVLSKFSITDVGQFFRFRGARTKLALEGFLN